MRTFFKIFFACLLALVTFTVVGFFVTSAVLSGLVAKEKEGIDGTAVLVVDLSESFQEVAQNNPLQKLRNGNGSAPSVYDVVRLIDHARNDSAVKGIYIKAGGNANGFGTSEEIRNALLNFK